MPKRTEKKVKRGRPKKRAAQDSGTESSTDGSSYASDDEGGVVGCRRARSVSPLSLFSQQADDLHEHLSQMSLAAKRNRSRPPIASALALADQLQQNFETSGAFGQRRAAILDNLARGTQGPRILEVRVEVDRLPSSDAAAARPRSRERGAAARSPERAAATADETPAQTRRRLLAAAAERRAKEAKKKKDKSGGTRKKKRNKLFGGLFGLF